MSDEAKCEICGYPMPKGEEMFKYHGYSGNCPAPPLPQIKVNPFEELAKSWQSLAETSRKEADRIRQTVKAGTDAEDRCLVRAKVWDQCAADLLRVAEQKELKP